MLDVRLFKHVSVVDLEQWFVKLTRLPFIPQPGEIVYVGPAPKGSFFEDTVSAEEDWLVVRTGDPVANVMLQECLVTPADLALDEEDKEEMFEELVETYKETGFEDCTAPDFSSPSFATDFPPPQEF